MTKTLLAFFSRADENYFGGSMQYIDVGNTEVIAGKIKGRISTDIFKIEMKTPYAKDYNTCIEEAKAHKNSDARPELVSMPESIDMYDTIILGYPNYWGTMPMAVFTFLDSFDFTGKTILPFCTNEGSGMGSSEADIKKLCSGADVKKGLPINGSNVARADAQIESWLRSNGLM
ncbi:flavodoxin [Eggerthia catenaformis]|uniref:flavodoxin n=1 Tax=Eggerthia catenaformis TaxID=31973 RepID=UPI00248D76BF|nr:flavodoxin [Eggerthia catenaformis]